jgi:hypothetical protein
MPANVNFVGLSPNNFALDRAPSPRLAVSARD